MKMPERARQGFEQALDDHPFNTVDDLEEEMAQGIGFVWSGEASDVFTRIDRNICEIGPSTGSLQEIIEKARPDIEGWARDNQCTQILVQSGRVGMARALAPFGYEIAAVILRKRL